MRKIPKVLFTFVFLITFSFAISACAFSNNSCSHAWNEATCVVARTCTKCNTKQGQPLGHDFKPATCIAPESCSRCFETRGVALGHTFDIEEEFEGYTRHTCSVCLYYYDELDDGTITESFNLLESSIRWGYNDFSLRTRPTQRRAFYDLMYTQATNFHTVGNGTSGTLQGTSYHLAFAINISSLSLSANEAVEVWKIFKYDNPIFYWIDNFVFYSMSGTPPNQQVVSINICVEQTYFLQTSRTTINQTIEQEFRNYQAAVAGMTCEDEIVRTVHDKILFHNNYVFNSFGEPEMAAWAHNIVGIMERRGAVCSGYSKAFQLILNGLGIDAILVTGLGVVGSPPRFEPHAWNMVRINGAWYYVDITWNDTGTSTAIHTFFKQAPAQFEARHIPDTPSQTGINFLYALPIAS
jgi:hypothetical protein